MEKIGQLNTNKPDLLIKVQNNEYLELEDLKSLVTDLIDNNQTNPNIAITLVSMTTIASVSNNMFQTMATKIKDTIKSSLQSIKELDINKVHGYLGQWRSLLNKISAIAMMAKFSMIDSTSYKSLAVSLKQAYLNWQILSGQIDIYPNEVQNIDRYTRFFINTFIYATSLIIKQMATEYDSAINDTKQLVNIQTTLTGHKTDYYNLINETSTSITRAMDIIEMLLAYYQVTDSIKPAITLDDLY